MITVPASEFVKHFGRYKATAQREPVAITSHGHTSGYFVSPKTFENLTGGGRRAYSIEELPEEIFQGMLNTTMDPKYDYLNALLDETE